MWGGGGPYGPTVPKKGGRQVAREFWPNLPKTAIAPGADGKAPGVGISEAFAKGNLSL